MFRSSHANSLYITFICWGVSWSQIVLLGRSNCVPWFHWNVKNGCLRTVDFEHFQLWTACRFWPHVFAWNGSCIASWDGLLFLRIFSKTYSGEMMHWYIWYLVCQLAEFLGNKSHDMTMDHLAKSKHNCKAWRITSHRYLSCTKTSMVQFQTQPIPCLGSWHRGERGKNRQNFKN